MSVGHIARAFEQAGIATVVIAVYPFARRLESMSLPRTILTDNLIGRVMGKPFEVPYQVRVITKALELLETAESNGTIWSGG